MRVATTISLALLVLSIPAAKASAVPIDVWYFLEGRFEGVPGTPQPGYAGGDLEVTWTGDPDGSITGSTGTVRSFYIGDSINQFFGDYYFSGFISLSAMPSMVTTIDLPSRTMSLSGPAVLSGHLTCNDGFYSCDTFGLDDDERTPIYEELTVDFVLRLATSDPLEPARFSMSTTPLGAQVGDLRISLSMSGIEIEREVPEPTTGVLLTLGLALLVRSSRGNAGAKWSHARAPRARPRSTEHSLDRLPRVRSWIRGGSS